MRINLHCYFSIILMFALGLSAPAQLKTSFSFGNLLPSGGGTTTFSGSIVIEGNNQCFTIKNGVPLFDDNKKLHGKFMIACPTEQTSDFELTSYPNPAYGITKVYASGQINPEDKFSLFLFTSTGERLQVHSGNLGQFVSGMQLNLTDMPAGIYFVKVKTLTATKTFKIIKTGD